jgi:hypothetical protein
VITLQTTQWHSSFGTAIFLHIGAALHSTLYWYRYRFPVGGENQALTEDVSAKGDKWHFIFFSAVTKTVPNIQCM